MTPAKRVQAALLCLLSILLVSCARTEPRNLLLICLDTVRADHFFDAQIEDELSPWLNGALRYEAARTSAPWTVPAIASVFTGLYPSAHGAGRFSEALANLDEQAPTRLDESAWTLADHLAKAGWSTAAFTAHPWLTSGYGLEQGFGVLEADKGHGPVTQRLLRWIAAVQAEGPWFAYLHWMEAHDRHLMPPRQLRAYLDGLSAQHRAQLARRASPLLCDGSDPRRCMKHQVYIHAVHELRAALAQLLQDMADSGELDNTVVVVFSDHGEGFKEHAVEHQELQIDPRGFYGMGHGQFHYREVMDVPLLAWVPGVEGARIGTNVSLVDIFPSALSWLDLDDPAAELDGARLPVTDQGVRQDRAVYASNIAYGPESVAVQRGAHKAIYWPGEDRTRVFDLLADPEEKQPLVGDGVQLELEALVGDYLEREAHSAEPTMPSGEQLRELQSIGYLQGVETTGDEKQRGPEHDPAVQDDNEENPE